MRALIDADKLTSRTIKGRQHPVIARADVDHFMETYVSLHALAAERGQHMIRLLKKLRLAGIEPALDPDEIGARFYRREDVSDVQ